jgi:NADPH:quinone reductase-like Zn-dependent oxidoreductase
VSGSIGSAAVQLAKQAGAHVTAVCNTQNVELVRALGADEVVDYRREDFTRKDDAYDLVFDAVGKHSFRRCRRSLKPGGTYMTTDGGFMWHAPILAVLTRWIGHKRVRLGVARYRKEDVLFLEQLLEAGKYRPVIDRRYPLEQVVEATRYVETGQKTGSVVLTLSRDGAPGTSAE